MSERTAQANKAILEAWKKEQELVKNGKGTRNWTIEQQKDIMEKGKAYDDNGVAFQGQHMKSVEQYPEYQGEPGNIQFLTRAEHLEAHNGSWGNPTNWYFDPDTKAKLDFGDGLYIECEVIQLSESVAEIELIKEIPVKVEPSIVESKRSAKKTKKSFGKRCLSALGTAKDVAVELSEAHPVATGIIKTGLATIAAITLEETVRRTSANGGGYGADYDQDNGYGGFDNDYSASKEIADLTEREYTPNDVPAGRQRYHYADGRTEWKEKPSYHREGKKNK